MIYDCFMYFNEVELLELRILELKDTVDQFIIVEGNTTHSGKPKANNLRKDLDSILDKHNIEINYDTFMIDLTECTQPWERENKQRLGIDDLLEENLVRSNDTIMVSDIDEIPNKNFIKTVLESNHSVVLNKQHFHYYTFNYKKPELCHGTVILRGDQLTDTKTTQYYRDNRFTLPWLNKYHGWHLSFFGGAQRVKTKIESFAHTEFSHKNDINDITAKLAAGKDIFDRDNEFEKLTYDPDNMDVPFVIRDNRDQFKHFFGKIIPI